VTTDNKFLVTASLTGTDRDAILQQTEELQPPVPDKGTPEYETFLANFGKSPANIVTTTAQFLQDKVGWTISSDTNYQDYLNQYTSAPFVAGMGGSSGTVAFSVHTIDDLLDNIATEARLPASKREALVNEYGLDDWFSGDFEGADKTLQIITQILQSSDGIVTLVFSNLTLKIAYFRPSNFGHLRHKPKDQPTYKVSGGGPVSTITMRQPSYFKQNAANFLGFGLTNVRQWLSNNNTPPTTSDVDTNSGSV
jgi:hypothetical protein